MKPLLLSLSLLAGCLCSASAQQLSVSPNGRYLTYSDGSPFFYLGDTAWELFHRLDKEEADHYLENRAAKGFTVIQAVVLAQLGGLTAPNALGDLPLVDSDPEQPVEAYFKHVDTIVEKAASLGLFIGMLPTWGSYWSTVNGDEKIFDSANARRFGAFLGERYQDAPIIWILGGDENINNEEERSIIESMAAGLREGDGGTHLITFHPRGPGLSSDYFHDADWLDFNMYQSSHGGHDHDNGLYAEHDRGLDPAKPTLDGEPRYELIPVGFYFAGANRLDLFDDYDSRQAAWWSLLAGACGHTYGHNSIWQMWAPGRDPVLGAEIPWREALDHPGSFQMKHLADFFLEHDFQKLAPNQELVLSGPGHGGAKVRAALADDASFLVAYSPRGEAFTLDLRALDGNSFESSWYDPRYGITFPIHTGNTSGIQTFTPPTSGRGRDWVLLVSRLL